MNSFFAKIIGLVIFLYFSSVPAAFAGDEEKCVILLHGLGRTASSMSILKPLLKQAGYRVINKSYPSTKYSIDTIARYYIQPMVDACMANDATDIAFITHSLGGIVLHKYLEQHQVSQLTHVIMLGPPNHGSPIVDKLYKYWMFKQLLGPAAQELMIRDEGIKYPLERHYVVGIIAGNAGFVPFSTLFFGEENDGKVSVASTQMSGVDDYILLPVGHTFMMNSSMVKENIIRFLKTGQFVHASR